MTKQKIINLYGSPSAGKSTGAAYIFSKLKLLGHNVELVTEFAKDLTYQKSLLIKNQIYVTGVQISKVYQIFDLNPKVELIITDSPILLGGFYNNHFENPMPQEALEEILLWYHHKYENLNYFIERNKPYNPIGRNQTEEEANVINKELFKYLQKLDIKFDRTVLGAAIGYDIILEDILIGKERT